MKVIAKKNRELNLINAQNTQNENRAETITLVVPEEYEDYNKKIVFITDDETVWDIITNNEYKITNAITKYKQVDFYIWLTKEVDGESIDFRTKTKTLSFYHNEDASDEITDEEIHGVNTVVNLLEEEIEKVENLNIEATKIGDTTTVTITKKDGTTESVEINDGVDGQDGQDGRDGQDGYTPQKGIDYFTEQDIEEIETDVKEDVLDEVYTKSETDTLLEGKADVEDIPDVSSFITKDVNNLTNYTLKTNTGSLIDLEINDTTYVVTLKLKSQDGTVISTDTIDLPLESVVVSGRYDNTTKKVILTLENGSEVDFSVADLVAGLQTEITSQNKLASDLVDDTNSGNKFVTTSEKQTWNNKLDESDLTDYVKNTDYATGQKGGTIKIAGSYGFSIDGGGYINPIYLNNYNEYLSKSNNYAISKGTLENVIAGKELINQTQLEESQESQDEEIEKLQEENARFKATLPTTTGEGQDITLDKTAELEFIKPPLPRGNSEQESTEGYQLIDLSEKTTATINNITATFDSEKGTVILNGTASADTTFDLIALNNLTIGDTYYLSGCPNGGSPSTYRLLMSDVTVGSGADYGSGTTYKIQNNQLVVRIAVMSGNNCNNLVFKPLLAKSSVSLPWEPYTNGASPNPDYPQEITNVTGDVEVKVQNKNIVKIDNVEQTTINGLTYSIQNGILTINGTANNGTSIILANNISLKQGTYTHSINDIKSGVYFSYDNISNTMLRVLSGTKEKSKTFQLAENTIYNRYILWIDNGTSFNNEKFYLQTEKNSTATEWNTHQEQVFPLTLGNIELCKIGDYQDYFYKQSNKWYLHKEIGKEVLNGTQNIAKNDSDSSNYLYYMNLGTRKIGGTVLSNKLTYKTLGQINGGNDVDTVGISTLSTSRLFYFNLGYYLTVNTVAGVNSYLTGNNITVYYQLEEPVNTEITDTTLISQLEAINNAISYEEQTNISGTSDGSNPVFNVEAYQNTKLVLQDISNAIVALGGV